MLKTKEIKVLDKGYVRYIDHLGSDSRIVEAARVSYRSPSKGEEKDRKLLNYLYKNKHTSPFEMVEVTFNIKLPLFVQAQLVRHRTANLNQISARYTKMVDEFYFPEAWRYQDTKNKQGSIDGDNFNPRVLFNGEKYNATEATKKFCDQAYRLYEEMIESGIAREMARMVLPQNLYTEIYWKCDGNNLLKFFKLRMDEHAQYEIRQYANAMFTIFEELFPWTAAAYKED